MFDIRKMDKNFVLIAVAVIAIVITGGLIYARSSNKFTLPSIFGMSDSQIGKEAISYINDNGLSPSAPATLVGVSEASGLVKISIKIGTQTFDSYATKDGKLLFPQAFDMTPKKAAAAAPASANATPASTQPAAPVTKTSKPELDAFVVSSCPFGLQMQRAIVEAVKTLPSLAPNIVVRYIGSISNGVMSSMHGPEEAQENLRQICIREEQPAKFYSYLACYMKKTTATAASGMPLGDSTGCQASTGIDAGKLASCVSDPTRGLAYAQKDFDLNTKYGIQGSPTLVLNGAQISENNYGGRSADGVKSMVCAGFTTAPGYCSTKLNTTEAATSFYATYSAGGATAASAAAPSTACATPAQQ